MVSEEFLEPIHSGEILREECMAPLALSAEQLARELHLPVEQIDEIVAGTRDITPDIATRLAQRFGTSAQFWMNLHEHYEEDCRRLQN